MSFAHTEEVFWDFLILFTHPRSIKLAAQNQRSVVAFSSVGGGNPWSPHPAEVSAGLALPTPLVLSVLWWGVLGVPCGTPNSLEHPGGQGRNSGGE